MEELYTIIEVADTLQYAAPNWLLLLLQMGKSAYDIMSSKKREKLQEEHSKLALENFNAFSAAMQGRQNRNLVPGFSDGSYLEGYSMDYTGTTPGSYTVPTADGNVEAMGGDTGDKAASGGKGNVPGNKAISSAPGVTTGSTFDPDYQPDGPDDYDQQLDPLTDQAEGTTRSADQASQGKPHWWNNEDFGEYEKANKAKLNAAARAKGYENWQAWKDAETGLKESDILNEDGTVNVDYDGPGSLAAQTGGDTGGGTQGGNKGVSANLLNAQMANSVAEMYMGDSITDQQGAQLYQGSNVVNPYANFFNLSGLAKDTSGLLEDRTGLLENRYEQARREGWGMDTAGLATDLSEGRRNLAEGYSDLSDRISNLRAGAEDYSGLATDTSVLASNPYANLQIATQAADMQVQEADKALANTLSTIRVTGAGAGGATAIAQAALQSKLGVSAVIEQQEAKNTQLRAEGQQQIETIKMNESRRLQEISLTERLRLEGLREREGLRLDSTRLEEGRALRDLGISEGRELRGLSVEEGRRLQGLAVDDRLRERDLRLGESLREQDARFSERGRLQEAQIAEQLRMQQLQVEESRRIQEADAIGRDYQFRVAETRETNALNRMANMRTQMMQAASDTEAAAMAAQAQTDAAWAGAFGGILDVLTASNQSPSNQGIEKGSSVLNKNAEEEQEQETTSTNTNTGGGMGGSK